MCHPCDEAAKHVCDNVIQATDKADKTLITTMEIKMKRPESYPHRNTLLQQLIFTKCCTGVSLDGMIGQILHCCIDPTQKIHPGER